MPTPRKGERRNVRRKPLKKPETHVGETRPKQKRRNRRRSRTSPLMLRAAAKQAKALELRRSGASFDEIASKLGYVNKGGAYKAVMAGLNASISEPAEELRELERERLDAMLKAIWPKVKKGQFGAIDRALKVSDRRAAIDGLDAPKRIEQNVNVSQLTDEQLDALARGKQVAIDASRSPAD